MPIDVTDVARYPLPGTVVPASVAFSPDGRAVTWLHSAQGTLERQLWSVDIATGERHVLVGGGVSEDDLSLEEKLRRERARELSVGVTSYQWAKDAPVLLVPTPGGLLCGPADSLAVAVPAGSSPFLDPQLSPDGSLAAYVQDDEIHVARTDGSAPPAQVTGGAYGTGRTHGLADFISQEEMDQPHGFWWSPDSRRLAFLEIDETHIPTYRIVHQGSDAVGDGAQEDHRYPFAGRHNPTVRLGVVDATGAGPASTRWLDLGAFEYLARVDWLDGDHLVVQLEDRRQSRLDVVRFDVTSGERTVLLHEQSDVWINLHKLLRPLTGGRTFLWGSERTGFMHLEVRDGGDGSLVRTLTDGEWLVTGVAAVTDDRVWFTATKDSPLERHLYSLSIEGGEAVRLTHAAGTHDVVVDAKSGRFVDTWSSLEHPPSLHVRALSTGGLESVLFEESDPRVGALALRPPELTTVTAADGSTELHVAVYRPPHGHGPFPTVVSVYGGPHAQRVTNSWSATVRMRDQYLRELGYVVVAVDNRGSANRGLAFEGAIRHNLGEVEVDDQLAAVRQLAEQGLVDLTRGVAIHGWSYGGYMSAMCLAKGGDVFKVAISGAPVTHWDGYDTHYTERYMGLPEENAEGYERSSVMAHVQGMRQGKLLLVHGLIDENVHFRHTARLINALIRARLTYQLLLFPDERHVPRREEDRLFMEEQIRDFLGEHLPIIP